MFSAVLIDARADSRPDVRFFPPFDGRQDSEAVTVFSRHFNESAYSRAAGLSFPPFF